jgi:hypothetical protein
MPEPIVKHDGTEKNGHRFNAGQCGVGQVR